MNRMFTSGSGAARWPLAALAFLSVAVASLQALDRPDVTFKVFQFPQDRMPRIDGDMADWAIVPDDYAIRTDRFTDDR